MVGRYRSKDGIIYPFTTETSKLDDKLHFNIDFDSIIKDGYKIIVLNHQPGIGKTHTVMDYLLKKSKEDEKFTFFYFTDRHKTIDEQLKRLKDDGDSKDKRILDTFAHWKGFGKYCDDELVEKLLELNISIDIIRKHLGFDECYKQYEKQFNNTKRVFAPFPYLSNEHFLNNPPKIVFLDERITQIDTYTFDKERIAKALESMKASPKYIENAKKGNKEYFHNEKILDEIKGLYQKRIIAAIERDTKSFNKFKEFNPYKLEQYIRWSKIYDYKNDLYSYPLYYSALDVVVKDIPIVIMDATFNKKLFSYFLESYNGEMKALKGNEFKGFKDLRVKILNSDASNKKTTIYRMHPSGCWSKSSLTDYKDTTWIWLLEDLKELRDIFGDANIGIITFKDLRWLFDAMNFEVEYFGNLRGTNKLEKKLVLVIIGAWLPLPPSWSEKDKNSSTDVKDADSIDEKKEYIDYLAEKYFLRKITKNDVGEVKVGAPLNIEGLFPKLYDSFDSKARIRMSIDSKIFSKEGVTKFGLRDDADIVDEFPISMINTIWFDEIYQAFHRNRGLRYQRIIFSYAWFPEPNMTMQKENGSMVPELLTRYNLRKDFPSTNDMIQLKDDATHEPSIKKVMDEEEKKKIFDTYKKQYKGGLMQTLMENIELDENSYDIADKFSINKRGNIRSRDTKPITELKKTYEKVKELVQYSEK